MVARAQSLYNSAHLLPAWSSNAAWLVYPELVHELAWFWHPAPCTVCIHMHCVLYIHMHWDKVKYSYTHIYIFLFNTVNDSTLACATCWISLLLRVVYICMHCVHTYRLKVYWHYTYMVPCHPHAINFKHEVMKWIKPALMESTTHRTNLRHTNIIIL